MQQFYVLRSRESKAKTLPVSLGEKLPRRWHGHSTCKAAVTVNQASRQSSHQEFECRRICGFEFEWFRTHVIAGRSRGSMLREQQLFPQTRLQWHLIHNADCDTDNTEIKTHWNRRIKVWYHKLLGREKCFAETFEIWESEFCFGIIILGSFNVSFAFQSWNSFSWPTRRFFSQVQVTYFLDEFFAYPYARLAILMVSESNRSDDWEIMKGKAGHWSYLVIKRVGKIHTGSL